GHGRPHGRRGEDVQAGAGQRGDVGARLLEHGDEVLTQHPARARDEPTNGHAAILARSRSGSHQPRLSRYQATVSARPWLNGTLGAYPSSSEILLMSREYRRSWPLRSVTGTTRSQPAPTALSSSPVSSLLVISVPPPMW